jgi:RNA polymerase sigma-70 factor, ECF subfamily
MQSAAERQALDELFSLAYEELRRLARSMLRHEYVAQITPTTLVNEVWMKLAATPQAALTTPLHFRRIAARAMRQILVDAARRREALVHGGGSIRVTLDDFVSGQQVFQDRDVLALEDALVRLAERSPRQAQLVEARFFGGLSGEECGQLLGISESTVMREWRMARAWLAGEIRRTLDPASEG